MHPLDVVFSNLRLSVVQITSYGHSSSSHGSKVDYFIGGEEVENWEIRHGHLVRRQRFRHCLFGMHMITTSCQARERD